MRYTLKLTALFFLVLWPFLMPQVAQAAGEVVTSLTLINADTDQPIAEWDPLPDGSTVDLTTLPTQNLNIRANTSPATVGSVRFGLNGISTYHTENNPPYALAADSNGNYNPWIIGPGTYTVTATPYESSSASGLAGTPLTITFTMVGAPGLEAFEQNAGPDGIVSIEAENHHYSIPQGSHSWTPTTTNSGYSGTEALRASPSTATKYETDYLTKSPRLDYQVNFVQTGTHYIWIRGIGPTLEDDSVHAGLDGQATPTADRISSFFSTWGWSNSSMDGPAATIDVTTAGVHTIHIWMREDATEVDKLVITSNPSYVPTGLGPAESPRVSGSPEPGPTPSRLMLDAVQAIDTTQSTAYRITSGVLTQNFGGNSSSTLYRIKFKIFANATPVPGKGNINVEGTVLNEDDAEVSITVIPENEEGNPDFVPDPVQGNVTPLIPDLTFIANGVMLAEGMNDITAHAIDSVGLEAFNTMTVTLDLTPPGRPGVNPVTSPTGLMTQVVTGTKDARTAILLNDVEVVPVDAEDVWEYEVNLSVEGANTLKFEAQDEAGNISTENAVTIVRDTAAPIITILTPTDQATLGDDTVHITGTVDDSAALITSTPPALGAVTVAQGYFIIEDVPLVLGGNPITVTASTSLSSSESITVFYDDQSLNPAPPVVDLVMTPTPDPNISFTGSKESGTTLWVNGVEEDSNTSTSWAYNTSLTHGNQLFSFHVKDTQGRISRSVIQKVLLDNTQPTKPLVTAFSLDPEEGTGLVSLHAEWSSVDPETNITAYDCGIGSTPTIADILPLQSVTTMGYPANANSVVKPGINLTQGDTFYLIVQATNEVGLTSALGTSQGVFVNRNTPMVDSVSLADYSKLYHVLPLSVSVTSNDPDGDPVEFRFTLDGVIHQDWSVNATDSFAFTAQDFGTHLLRVEARDPFNGLDFKSIRFFILEQPPTP